MLVDLINGGINDLIAESTSLLCKFASSMYIFLPYSLPPNFHTSFRSLTGVELRGPSNFGNRPPRDSTNLPSHLDQLGLARDDSAVLDGRSVGTSNVSVDRQVPVKVRKDLLGTRDIPPVAHQIADDGEHADELDACLLHAGVGRVADELGVSAASFDVGEDGVALGAERQSEEGGADIGGDTGDDDLLLAGGLDGGAEIGVVPSTVV